MQVHKKGLGIKFIDFSESVLKPYWCNKIINSNLSSGTLGVLLVVLTSLYAPFGSSFKKSTFFRQVLIRMFTRRGVR